MVTSIQNITVIVNTVIINNDTESGKESMKLKDGFVLRKIADQYMAVPVGARAKELHGMIGLNETGAFIWERLSKGQTQEEIVKALCEEYEVEENAAATSVQRFFEKLSAEGMMCDD